MALQRAHSFCTQFNLSLPIIMGPMAGACPPLLAASVSFVGGMGSCGCAPLSSFLIDEWVEEFKKENYSLSSSSSSFSSFSSSSSSSSSSPPFMLNLWIPDQDPQTNETIEQPLRQYLQQHGPPLDEQAGKQAYPQHFSSQCSSLLSHNPTVISSIMGLYPSSFIQKLKKNNISYFATVTSVKDAKKAVKAGCTAIIAQGIEAGGHYGVFNPSKEEEKEGKEEGGVGLMALIPAIVDVVPSCVPVIATGGIVDGRGVAAALMLGASAVQVGTGLLRSNEANIHPAWSAQISKTNPEDTIRTRAYTGRLARGIKNTYILDAESKNAPPIAPYPIQRGLTKRMREEALREGDIKRMQAWAGQGAKLAKVGKAGEIVKGMWEEALEVMEGKR